MKLIFGPGLNFTLISFAKAAKDFFLQPLAFILVGINAPPPFFLITSVHSGVKVGKWPSLTTLFREFENGESFESLVPFGHFMCKLCI